MLAVKLNITGFDVGKFASKMGVNLPEEAGNELFNYSKYLAKKLQLAAVTDPKRPITNNRRTAASRIQGRKLSKNRSEVVMPNSLVMLDSMSPHYVSLKRGRNITRWARQNYGTATVSGRSTARFGPRGGIKGSLYVVPHRFVQPTLNKERNKLPNYMRKAITKAYKASASYN